MLNRLKNFLRQYASEGIALAFSGGTDSTLLLAVLSLMNQESPFAAKALTIKTVLQDGDEMAAAKNLAQKFNIPHYFLTFAPLAVDAIKNNRPDRCYHCKKAIFTTFFDTIKKHNIKYLIDGTNADDLQVYRPGRKALEELGVISPLALLGITKAQIRKLSAELGLPTAGKPATPCLATRFEYNTILTEENISRVTAGEKILKQMFPRLENVRLRVHGNLARLEVPAADIPLIAASADTTAKALQKLGFDFITLDLNGFRSGCFDQPLKKNLQKLL